MRVFLKKLLSAAVAATLFAETMGLSFAAAPETMAEKLAASEKTAYGVEQTGALLDRVNRLEKDFLGGHASHSSVKERVDSVYELLLENDMEPSIVTKMNAIEWGITRSVSMDSVQKRVTDMEILIEGKPTEGTYRERIERLSGYAFGTEEIPLVRTEVPINTLVKVSLVTPVNAKSLKAGDQIEIKAEEDVVESGALLFANGAPGYGTVEKVVQAKNFGRDAEVNINFEALRAVDGTNAAMTLGEASKKKMESMAMAAGASVAGMVLLGPIGIIGGAFVRGKNIDLPSGTELYIQTKEPLVLYGIKISDAEAESAEG